MFVKVWRKGLACRGSSCSAQMWSTIYRTAAWPVPVPLPLRQDDNRVEGFGSCASGYIYRCHPVLTFCSVKVCASTSSRCILQIKRQTKQLKGLFIKAVKVKKTKITIKLGLDWGYFVSLSIYVFVISPKKIKHKEPIHFKIVLKDKI